jgi:hypothetical protein
LYWNSSSNQLFSWSGTVWILSTGFNEFTPFLATGTPTARNLVTIEADYVNVKNFGAVGDYTTDDTAAINAALAVLPSTGGAIYIPRGRYRTTSTITINKNNVTIIGDGGGNFSNTLFIETLNNVAVCAPSGATQIIGDFVTGSVIRIKNRGCSIRDLTIDSTSNASGGNAPISTGAAGRKGGGGVNSHGIELMADDIPGESVLRFNIRNVAVYNQPTDGIICIDNIVSSRIDFTEIVCCNRHAINIQSGTHLGRINAYKPGQVQLNNIAASRCGGHGLLVGRRNEASITDVPYRIEINNYETYTNLITPAFAEDPINPANIFLSGENHVIMESAADGLNRFGLVLTPAHSTMYVQGRNIDILNYRAIDGFPYGIYVGVSPSIGTWGINVQTYYQANSVAPPSNPAIFISSVSARQVTAIAPLPTTSFVNLTNKLIGSRFYESYNGIVTSDVQQNHQEINGVEINADAFRSTINPTSIQIQDDEAFYIEFNQLTHGLAAISSNIPARKSGIFNFRCGDAFALAEAIASSATNVAVTTGPLTGTTGVDGDLTFSVDAALNRIYIENRTSGNGAYSFTFYGFSANSKITSYAII